jgi:hypothetical protein
LCESYSLITSDAIHSFTGPHQQHFFSSAAAVFFFAPMLADKTQKMRANNRIKLRFFHKCAKTKYSNIEAKRSTDIEEHFQM